jgi:hypothetical protein
MRKMLFLVAVSTLGLGAVGCEEPLPENPTWAVDIKPLVEARCVRCHGAGGTLNDDPDSPPLPKSDKEVPQNGYFNMLENDGAKHGLKFYGGALKTYLNLPMPPPPASPLSDREKDLLIKWGKNPI